MPTITREAEKALLEVSLNKERRIADLERALRRLHKATLHPDNVLRGAGLREALDEAERLLE